jgi:hypothetical protein
MMPQLVGRSRLLPEVSEYRDHQTHHHRHEGESYHGVMKRFARARHHHDVRERYRDSTGGGGPAKSELPSA